MTKRRTRRNALLGPALRAARSYAAGEWGGVPRAPRNLEPGKSKPVRKKRTRSSGSDSEIDPQLDAIAASLSRGAKFKNLSPREQEMVRRIAGQMTNPAGGPPIRSTLKSGLTLYDKGVQTAYDWTAGLPSRLGHALLSNPCNCPEHNPSYKPMMLLVGIQMSHTPPHPAEDYNLQGPWKFIPKYTTVHVLERGRGGHRFLVRADYFGAQFWAWVDKENLGKYDPDDPTLKNNPKTKLDLILDRVVAREREVTFDVRDYTEEQKQRIIEAAEARGLHAASDGKHILVRDLRKMNPALRISTKDPATMTAGEVNKELDHLYKIDSKLTDEMIAAGRGHERPSDYWPAKPGDTLAEQKQTVSDRMHLLRWQIEKEYGPGAPARFPHGWKRSRKKNGRRNPQAAADRMYEVFHGKPPDTEILIEEEVHEHEHLATLGRMVSLVVETRSDKEVTLGWKDGDSKAPWLACDETGTQLYIEGGDQSIPLGDIGMGGKEWIKDSMVIGDLVETTYRTEKDFDKFETIDYYHANGEESGEVPQLLYDPRSKKMYISGGKYRIEHDGIID